jgi:hypothetical protein
MSKLIALCSGGDWADANVEHLVLPDEVDLHAEQEKWRTWYIHVYCPALEKHRTQGARAPVYYNLSDWLKRAGAREPTDTELQLVWED